MNGISDGNYSVKVSKLVRISVPTKMANCIALKCCSECLAKDELMAVSLFLIHRWQSTIGLSFPPVFCFSLCLIRTVLNVGFHIKATWTSTVRNLGTSIGPIVKEIKIGKVYNQNEERMCKQERNKDFHSFMKKVLVFDL